MSEKLNVTVDETGKTMRIGIANYLGTQREFEIDATSATSIIAGLVNFATAGDQLVEAKMQQLTNRIAELEKQLEEAKAAKA